MKNLLLAISILCLSSSVFSQQRQPRTNYYYYGMDAGTLNVIQINVDAKVNVFLFDDANFQNYRDGKVANPTAGGQIPFAPYYLVPPKQQHWYLVIDAGGRPFTATVHIRLFSNPKELDQKKS